MRRKRKHWSHALVRMGACDDAVLWARQFDTFEEAWLSCHEGRWIYWLLYVHFEMRDGSVPDWAHATFPTLDTDVDRPETSDIQLAWADAIRAAVTMPRLEGK